MKIIVKESQYKRLVEESIEDFEKSISDEGEFKDILSDETIESEYKDEIKKLLKRVRDIVYPSSEEKSMSAYDGIMLYYNITDKLKNIKKFLNHPIHINQYKDKYGNVFLQARASYNSDGKVKYVNSYVGTLDDFPEGVKSSEAKKKGKILVRKKLEPIYNLI